MYEVVPQQLHRVHTFQCRQGQMHARLGNWRAEAQKSIENVLLVKSTFEQIDRLEGFFVWYSDISTSLHELVAVFQASEIRIRLQNFSHRTRFQFIYGPAVRILLFCS